jgi:predicted small integral membrane protein
MGNRLRKLAWGVFLSGVAPFAAAHTDEGCASFPPGIARALVAMEAPALSLDAGTDAAHAAILTPGTHYAAKLLPQSGVSFMLTPARAARSENPRAGLFSFATQKAGRYRIGLTTGHWIDVLDGNTVIGSTSHEGRSGCALLHKVVEFELPANRTLTLQLSGQEAAVVGLIVIAD